ncbi:MMPL family transporter [Actinoallomurus purpureus]|uniref:MMPL family transporter n=1 Tax=Actinoallomurus purpureus TaxID=478114 RepID=UPI002092AA1F|nr:MMPL family transporter [Actinoallomurus purpureus]MCO6003648.1 MMPL family transporter [Actinoallomurus purpureus]
MSALARWCHRHRLAVVLLWLAALAGLGVLSQTVGSAYKDSFSLPGTESTKALQLLQKSAPAQSGDSATVVWRAPAGGTVRDDAVRRKMTATLATISKLPSVTSVTGPYDGPRGARQISRDGTTAYAQVGFGKQANELAKPDVQRVIDAAEAARGDGLRVELGGNPISQVERTPPGNAELIGVAAAALVLLIAFGSLFAMLLPILTAIAGVGSGLMAVTLLTHVVTVGQIGPTLGALIGLGVGIDYALFIVTRHRAGLKNGLSVEESVVKAIDTSGRAVLFAGGTVVIALLGLFVLGMSFLNGMAIASAVTVVCTVFAAITLLPALLGLLKTRVLSRRERRRLGAEGSGGAARQDVWTRWAGVVERRPRTLSAVALVAIAVLCVPVFSLRLGSSDAGNNPTSTTTRQAYDLLAEGFGPGFNGPLQLIAETHGAADRQAFTRLVGEVSRTRGVAAAVALPARPGATIAMAQVVPTTSPQSEQTSDLIDRLRHDVVPAAERGTSLRVYVGGQTAIFDDFAGVLTGKLPLFLGVIITLGFLLLLIAFRSLLVPAVAAVMNVLSAGASFGVVVAFFQWGWGSEPLGVGAAGPIEAFLPVIMLSILFGLSMDYQVFLVSRMHEEWVHSGDNRRAVTVGQAHTGRVITAAATIMIAVFVAFVFGGQRVIAEFGIGLSAAVALDAFILRTILVPAAMHLFGRANWWLPSWLDRRLPHLSVEPPEERPIEGAVGTPLEPASR